MEGHRETYDKPLKHRWRNDPENKADVSASETGGTENLKRGGNRIFKQGQENWEHSNR